MYSIKAPCFECKLMGEHTLSCASRGEHSEFAVEWFDGGSRDNPGKAAFAWVLEYSDKTTATDVRGLGVATNNVAEYEGLIHLLEYALAHGVKRSRVKDFPLS